MALPTILSTTLLVAMQLILLLRQPHQCDAHSWVECLDTDRSVVFDKAREFIYGGHNSAGKCQGYQRNYIGRGDHVHDEQLMVKILKDDYTKPNVAVCKPGQAAGGESGGFHNHIKVSPGTPVFYAYMPNGHVAVDKAARGTLYGHYWSGQPNVDLQFTSELTEDHLLDGKRHDFDDGVCGQTYSNRTLHELSGRAGDDFPCVGEFAIPVGTPPGMYSIVWMWKFWDEVNDKKEIVTVGGQYGGAAYSSCFDVEVVAPAGGRPAAFAPATVAPPRMRIEETEDASDASSGSSSWSPTEEERHE